MGFCAPTRGLQSKRCAMMRPIPNRLLKALQTTGTLIWQCKCFTPNCMYHTCLTPVTSDCTRFPIASTISQFCCLFSFILVSSAVRHCETMRRKCTTSPDLATLTRGVGDPLLAAPAWFTPVVVGKPGCLKCHAIAYKQPRVSRSPCTLSG